MTSLVTAKLAPLLGVGVTTIVSGSNANGRYQITSVDGVITRVFQFNLSASLAGTITWPVAFPDTNFVVSGNSGAAGYMVQVGGNATTSSTAFGLNSHTGAGATGVLCKVQAEWVKV